MLAKKPINQLKGSFSCIVVTSADVHTHAVVSKSTSLARASYRVRSIAQYGLDPEMMNAAEQCIQWRPLEHHPIEEKPFSFIHLICDLDSILFPFLQQNTFMKSFHYRSLLQSGTVHIVVEFIREQILEIENKVEEEGSYKG